MFTLSELAFLVRRLDETKDLQSPIGEVGCARGQATLYLNFSDAPRSSEYSPEDVLPGQQLECKVLQFWSGSATV
jgi:hypothetical protein